jgi:hypothetical protein
MGVVGGSRNFFKSFFPCRYLASGALILLLTTGVSICDAQQSERRAISVPELKRVLQSEDEREIVGAMNRVKQNQESHQLLMFVVELWKNNQTKYPDVPWVIVNSERIRIEVANVLAQAGNNGFVKIDREELRKYARDVISGSNEPAKSEAALTLGLINDHRDIKLLEGIALLENPQTFRASVIALAESCHPSGEAALAELRAKIRGRENREFVKMKSSELLPNKRCP